MTNAAHAAPAQPTSPEPRPALDMAYDVYQTALRFNTLRETKKTSLVEHAFIWGVVLLSALTYFMTRSLSTALCTEVTLIVGASVVLFRQLPDPLADAAEISRRMSLQPHPTIYRLAHEIHQQRPASWTEQLGEQSSTRFLIVGLLLLLLSLMPNLAPELMSTNDVTKPFADTWKNIQSSIQTVLPYLYVLSAFGVWFLWAVCFTDALRRKHIGAILLALSIALTSGTP